METPIIVAIITVAGSIIANVITLVATSHKSRDKIISRFNEARAETQTAQAVTESKLEELTREVRLHNGFAQRIPVLEEQIRVANHRIDDLEREAKNG